MYGSARGGLVQRLMGFYPKVSSECMVSVEVWQTLPALTVARKLFKKPFKISERKDFHETAEKTPYFIASVETA